MELRELREKRGVLAGQIRQLADVVNKENRDFSAEEQANWDKLNKDYDELVKQIERHERLEKIDVELAQPTDKRVQQPAGEPAERPRREDRARNPNEDKDNIIEGWIRTQCGVPLESRHLEVARRTGANFSVNELTIPLSRRCDPSETRAMGVGSGGGGTASPEVVPQGFVPAIEQAMLYFGPMRAVSSILRTESGNAMPWPTVNDTSQSGALLAENTAAAEQDVDVAAITFDAYKYSSKVVRVSVELMQDNAVNLPTLLGSLLGERLGRITNLHFTTGTGSAQPNGIVTASTLGKTAALATAITADELIDLMHSVDVAYRRTGCLWMAKDSTVAAFRKLKDSTNQYLWQPALTQGAPDMLFGYPVVVNSDMAAIATGAKTVIFGFIPLYKIREVIGITLMRLRERYAEFHQEAFLAFLRADGDLLNAGTNPVKYLQQA